MNKSKSCIIRLSTILVWSYFSDYLKKVTMLEKDNFEKQHLAKQLQIAINNDLPDYFDQQEKDKVYQIYEDNIIGKEIVEIIDDTLMYKLIAHLIFRENGYIRKYQVFDYLRYYDIDTTDGEADIIWDYFSKEIGAK